MLHWFMKAGIQTWDSAKYPAVGPCSIPVFTHWGREADHEYQPSKQPNPFLWFRPQVWTYFNYFQGRWVESLALLHYFALDGFVNLIPHHWVAHNVVLNFCRTKCISSVMRALHPKKVNNQVISNCFLLCIVPFSLRRGIFLLTMPLAHSMATSSR